MNYWLNGGGSLLDAEQMMANSSERKLLQIGLDCEKEKEGKEWER